MAEANYSSGADYVVEFLGYRFGFNNADFEQRVAAAADMCGRGPQRLSETTSPPGSRQTSGLQWRRRESNPRPATLP